MLVGTQTGRQEFEDAALRSFTVGARNDQPWTPGRVRVNGQQGGMISGPVTVTWRKRDGGAPAVVFDGDDVSYGGALTRIVVKSRGAVVKDVAGIPGESWAFEGEQALNGGAWFDDLGIEIYAQKSGVSDSHPMQILVTR